jgi:hypothetical protein
MFKPNTVMAFAIGFTLCYLLAGVMCMEILVVLKYPPDMAAAKAVNWPYEFWFMSDKIKTFQANRLKKLGDRHE